MRNNARVKLNNLNLDFKGLEFCTSANRRPNEAAIYGLFDPRSNHLIYLGQTKQLLSTRLDYHLGNRGVNKEVGLWLQDLKEVGLVPVIRAIVYIPVENIDVAEISWIAWTRKRQRITNVMDGGANPVRKDREGRKRKKKLINLIKSLIALGKTPNELTELGVGYWRDRGCGP